MYNEKYRPQFHFTAKNGWLNDPNGLVFYKGEYHLFFQHNPFGTKWGNMTWGHAVGPDLVHWNQMENALLPDTMGTMFSGSAVVDWDNCTGLQKGDERTLVAFYTADGGTVTPKVSTTQCLAYSNDRGRTWAKYEKNPIITEITPGNRDPKVFKYMDKGGKSKWIMVLYVDDGGQKSSHIHSIYFFSSDDLKKWTFLSKTEGFYECPDFFELAIDGNQENKKWILIGADFKYMIGSFDGIKFIPETAKLICDFGQNYYAAQTYSDIPEEDGRRIIIGWMNWSKSPEDMPFNQQMSFPCTLSLKTFPEGVRMCKYPVKEIEKLYEKTVEKTGIPVKSGENPLSDIEGELLDIDLEILAGSSSEFGLDIRGQKISYAVGEEDLSFNGTHVHLPMVDGKIILRILIDRTSVEIFGNEGRISISSCIQINPENRFIGFYCSSGIANLARIEIRSLKSSWK